LLASLIDGDPLPLERDLVDALTRPATCSSPRPGAGGDE
jgi:hypothetical protein